MTSPHPPPRHPVLASWFCEWAAGSKPLTFPVAAEQHNCCGMQDQKQKPDTDFVPNLVNTVCFVVNFIIQLSTFAVNYQGAPFNTPIMQTKGFSNMLKWSYIFCLAITWDALGIGTAFSLVGPAVPLEWLPCSMTTC